MKHLGDITKINGAEAPIVDVITGGSPCQDLSVAGKRAGLDGERSGLFMEQVRITKEMRDKDASDGRARESVRPRYMVWENVPGAFSSNDGKDFQAVLSEIVKIAQPDAPDVPMPDRGGWPKYGAIFDEMGGWSVAWRTHDAQYWGVPQRRRRICVLADFNGITAADILFDPQLRRETKDTESNKTIRDTGRKRTRKVQTVSESLFGDFEQSEETREGTAPGTEIGVGAYSFQERAGKPGGAREYSSRMSEQEPCQPSTTRAFSIQGNVIDRDAKQNGGGISVDVAHTINSTDRHGIATAFSQNQRDEVRDLQDLAGSLAAEPGMKQQTFVCTAVDCRNMRETKELNGTMQAKPNGGFSYNCNTVIREER